MIDSAVPGREIGHEVWYASPERIAWRARIRVFDDVGTLRFEHGCLVFEGSKSRIELESPRVVGLTRPAFAWTMWIPAILATVATLGPLYAWMGLLGPFLYGYAGWLVALFGVAMRRTWVEVEPCDPGRGDRAYFMDGRRRGWRAVLRGGGDLLAELDRPLAVSR